MRIAVCGTHCSGKTTLVEAFVKAHPDFVNEPEPYAVLVEDYGEEFSSEPGAQDFLRQLEFNVERLKSYGRTEDVIFERCPVDFLAYLLALKDLNREQPDSRTMEIASKLTMDAISSLDLIVFVPLDDVIAPELPAEEDPKLQRAVNQRLSAIFNDDDPGLKATFPEVIEVSGSTSRRLRKIEATLSERATIRG